MDNLIKRKQLSKREMYLNAVFHPYISRKATGLEIGPYDRPYLPRSEYPAVKYADVFSTEELLDRAAKNPRRDPDLVEKVDFVLESETLEQVVPHASMQYVFCSHVLEHVPNLISTLQHLETILVAGGVVLCAYPDRRFTFDINREQTDYRELVERFKRDTTKPDPKTVYDYFLNYRTVKVGKIWQELEGAVSEPVYTRAYAQLMADLSKETYVDVHCNIFTDSEFVQIIECLKNDNMLSLEVAEIENTRAPRNEFLVVLRKPQS